MVIKLLAKNLQGVDREPKLGGMLSLQIHKRGEIKAVRRFNETSLGKRGMWVERNSAPGGNHSARGGEDLQVVFIRVCWYLQRRRGLGCLGLGDPGCRGGHKGTTRNRAGRERPLRFVLRNVPIFGGKGRKERAD